MEDIKPECFPTEMTERGVITVKLEQVNVDADTVYCSNEQEQNWEELNSVELLKEDPLAQVETDNDSTRDSFAATTGFQNGFANTDVLKETEDEISVPLVEREVKVFVAGPTLPTPKNNNGPSITQKTRSKLEGIRPAICTKCHIGFPTADLLEHHQSTAHQDERPYSCRHCGKAFQTLSNCRKHENIHNPKRWQGEPEFQCDICLNRYHLKQSLDLHRKTAHLGYKPRQRPASAPVMEHHSTRGTRNPYSNRKPKQEHPCPHCDLKFDMRYLLKNHLFCHTKERPFSCPICQQPFSLEKLVKSHIRRVHERPTPSGMRHLMPKWQAGKPQPCSVCGKVFRVASQLRVHMTLHTGELSYACNICGRRFRLKYGLTIHIQNMHRAARGNNPLKLYKCLICGIDDFKIYSCYRNHRMKRHANILCDSEKEKPFACGVCGKPYYLREDAIICARLNHDPSSLLRDMFKHKCPECPEEMLGFRNLSVLRKHWGEAHGGNKLPTKLRVGMYNPNLKEDELPSCKVDKKKKQMWKVNGIPPEVLMSETPLYIELPLLPIPEVERFKAKTSRCKNSNPGIPKVYKCDLCGLRLSCSGNLSRHKKRAHNPLKVERKVGRPIRLPETESVPTVTIKAEVKEEAVDQNEADLKRSMFRNRFSSRRFVNVRTHEHRQHNVSSLVNRLISVHKCKTVNIHDTAGVKAVLNYQTVRVSLFKWRFPQGMLDKYKKALV